MSRYTRSGFEDCIADCTRAIEIDPKFGMAYAEMAAAKASLARYSELFDTAIHEEVGRVVRQARALDPDDPSVLTACASALCILGKPEDALPFAQRAVAVNPGLEYAHAGLGVVLVQLGRLDEGLAELEAAKHLGPNIVWSAAWGAWRSAAHLQAGRTTLALDEANQAVEMSCGTPGLVQRLLCLSMTGDWDGARATLRQMREIDPGIVCAAVENFVRYFHGRSIPCADYVAVVRKVWNEVEGNGT
jgi:tetratricopeptide (TPR) repeat protein